MPYRKGHMRIIKSKKSTSSNVRRISIKSSYTKTAKRPRKYKVK